MTRFEPSRYISVAMHFRCNLKCEHCMIEGTMDRLEPYSLDSFEEVLRQNEADRRWTGLIFTGSEITLRPDLPHLATRARESGFDHVRIQTHGMRLASRRYCDELVSAGVDEFFVSVTAADAATHDAITDVKGSFARTVRGLENLDEHDGVVALTNTVITERSYRQLDALVHRLGHLENLVQMEFWNYLPMSDRDDRGLLVANTLILPHLSRAISSARELGRDVAVKNFPECLLGDQRDAVDSYHAETLIDPDYWKEYERNELGRCAHRSVCTSTNCFGLTTAYVDKHGWDTDILRPFVAPPGQVAVHRRSVSAVSVPIRRR